MVRVTKVDERGKEAAPDSAPPGTVARLAVPRIERWVDVPDYDGYKAKLWINYPRALRSAFDLSTVVTDVEDMTEDEAKAFGEAKVAALEAALNAIVLEHNGWPDEQGYELAQPPATRWDTADQHLVNVVMRLALTAPGQLPNSQRPTSKR